MVLTKAGKYEWLFLGSATWNQYKHIIVKYIQRTSESKQQFIASILHCIFISHTGKNAFYINRPTHYEDII